MSGESAGRGPSSPPPPGGRKIVGEAEAEEVEVVVSEGEVVVVVGEGVVAAVVDAVIVGDVEVADVAKPVVVLEEERTRANPLVPEGLKAGEVFCGEEAREATERLRRTGEWTGEAGEVGNAKPSLLEGVSIWV